MRCTVRAGVEGWAPGRGVCLALMWREYDWLHAADWHWVCVELVMCPRVGALPLPCFISVCIAPRRQGGEMKQEGSWAPPVCFNLLAALEEPLVYAYCVCAVFGRLDCGH